MTPKEKAKELIDSFKLIKPTKVVPESRERVHMELYGEMLKKCALIACEEIWEECADDRDEYWQEVKKQIEKL